KPEKNKRGRTKTHVGANDEIMSDPTTPEELTPPAPAYVFTIFSYDKVHYESMRVYFELLAQHIASLRFFDRVCLFLLLSHILAPQIGQCHPFLPICDLFQ
ncbi:MAG: hypothetical protein ACKPKO_26180, partial [Candidatus Fonsibacter sp.]